MSDTTQLNLDRETVRCPVCGRSLVKLFDESELRALAHQNPPCEEYVRLDIKDFVAKYWRN